LRALLILVCLFICGCITQPHHPNLKPGERLIQYKILEVPLFGQETRMWCWAASGEMIMHYYGEEVPQYVQVDNRFKRGDCGLKIKPKDCSGWPELQRYEFKLPKQKKGALSWLELQEQIQANQPVGFSWEWKKCEGSKSSGSHYMVARGYIIINDTRLVVINDPLPAYSDKYKGGTVSIMTYEDYVQFCPRYIHSYVHYDITKPGSEQILEQKFLQGVQGGSFFKKRPPGRRRQVILTAAREGLEILKALPWPLQKKLGFESKAMVEKCKLGKKSFYTLTREPGRWQDNEEIPGDVLEVHYPVEVDKEPVASITTRKREGKWKFAVINDSKALAAVKTLNKMIAPREQPSYFMVQIQSMNLGFLAYFLEQEEEEMEENNTLLYLVPTHEDPDLTFPLYAPVPAAEVFLELKYLLEHMAEEKGGEALENQFTGEWHQMDDLLEDLDCQEKNTALSGVQRLVEIIDKVFTQLENQDNDLSR